MKRKILLSSISIAAAAATLGVGAFARYSDSETGGSATITAGTINLVVGGSASSDTFNETNAYPGEVMGGGHGFVLSNTGSLDGKLRVFIVKDADAENSLVEPETDVTDPGVGGEIDAFLNVTVDGNSFGYGGSVPWMGLANAAVGDKVDITSMIWGGQPFVSLPAGASFPAPPPPGIELWFGWAIDEDATNAIMTDSLAFHLEFTLDQA
jgi:hypothetical protein